MSGIAIQVSGVDPVARRLLALANDARGGGAGRRLTAAGRYMTLTEVPRTFETSGRQIGENWPRPGGWRASGQPLLDTGRLRKSIGYQVSTTDVSIGTNVVYARIHQEGGTIRPVNRRFLAIPQVPPLSVSDARVKKPRDFPGTFVLMKGPDGPGIYRVAKGTWRSTTIRGGRPRANYSRSDAGPMIERIFAFVRAVRIKKRTYLKWTPENLGKIEGIWQADIDRQVAKANGV